MFSESGDSIHIVFNKNDVSSTCTFDSSDISTSKFGLEDLNSTVVTKNKKILEIGKLRTS